MIGNGSTLAAGSEAGFSSAMTLMVVGLVVVFTTLVVLALVTTLLVRLGRDRSAGAVGAGDLHEVAARAEGIDRRHLVVISAAVAASAGPRARVHRVVVLGREAGRQWVAEGRAVVMGSHRLHR